MPALYRGTELNEYERRSFVLGPISEDTWKKAACIGGLLYNIFYTINAK